MSLVAGTDTIQHYSGGWSRTIRIHSFRDYRRICSTETVARSCSFLLYNLFIQEIVEIILITQWS